MFSSRMKNLHPYVPGEQPCDREYIKLNANENPYPPAPQAVSAAVDFLKSSPSKLALYPDPDSFELRKEIAAMLNRTGGVLANTEKDSAGNSVPGKSDALPFTVTPEMIYAGNGSDEVLSFTFYAFFDSSEKLVTPKFSYSFYPVYCGFYGIPMDTVPLKDSWELDTEEMILRANKNHSATIIANPNAPTSLCLSRGQVRLMLERCPKDRAFVVDEAYVDFGGESCIGLLEDFPNLVIVRTFSKSLCGAGFRLGYLVANPEMVNAVLTVKNSLNHFPVDAFTQAAARAVCKNDAYYADCAKKIVQERESFVEFLRARGWYVLQSTANFVFAKKEGSGPEKNYGKLFYEGLKKEGILVRRFDTAGIEEYIRITIGTKEQMDALKTAFDKINSRECV